MLEAAIEQHLLHQRRERKRQISAAQGGSGRYFSSPPSDDNYITHQPIIIWQPDVSEILSGSAAKAVSESRGGARRLEGLSGIIEMKITPSCSLSAQINRADIFSAKLCWYAHKERRGKRVREAARLKHRARENNIKFASEAPRHGVKQRRVCRNYP